MLKVHVPNRWVGVLLPPRLGLQPILVLGLGLGLDDVRTTFQLHHFAFVAIKLYAMPWDGAGSYSVPKMFGWIHCHVFVSCLGVQGTRTFAMWGEWQNLVFLPTSGGGGSIETLRARMARSGVITNATW